MVRNILTTTGECVFVSQPKQLGLENAVLYAERVIGDEPFAVLLADDCILADGAGVTANPASAFEASGNSQFSVIQFESGDFSNYCVIVPGED